MYSELWVKEPVVLSGKNVIFKTPWKALFRIFKRAGNITGNCLLCHIWAPLKKISLLKIVPVYLCNIPNS